MITLTMYRPVMANVADQPILVNPLNIDGVYLAVPGKTCIIMEGGESDNFFHVKEPPEEVGSLAEACIKRYHK